MVFDVDVPCGSSARCTQPSPFCPNIAATPDGEQVWFTLKDVGKTVVFDARPPFAILKMLDTGPITNHVNFVRNAKGQFAYVTVGGLTRCRSSARDDFVKVATIPVGKLPHGVWPSGDGTRVYVGLENADAHGRDRHADQPRHRHHPDRPGAAGGRCTCRRRSPTRCRRPGLQPLGVAGEVAHLELRRDAGMRRPAHQREPVRPGPGAGAAGRGHGS